MSENVYKIVPEALWEQAKTAGRLEGAPIDHRDGYIHLSTASQLRETAEKHFSGLDDCMLLAVESGALGEALVFEPSRGGDLFPHLYGTLPVSAVRWAEAMPLDGEGVPIVPAAVR